MKDPKLASAAATLAVGLMQLRHERFFADDYPTQEKNLASYYAWAIDMVSKEHLPSVSTQTAEQGQPTE